VLLRSRLLSLRPNHWLAAGCRSVVGESRAVSHQRCDFSRNSVRYRTGARLPRAPTMVWPNCYLREPLTEHPNLEAVPAPEARRTDRPSLRAESLALRPSGSNCYRKKKNRWRAAIYEMSAVPLILRSAAGARVIGNTRGDSRTALASGLRSGWESSRLVQWAAGPPSPLGGNRSRS
jgi:hypothetical protein